MTAFVRGREGAAEAGGGGGGGCSSTHTGGRAAVGLSQVCLSHPVCFSFSFFLYNTLSFPLYFPGKTAWKSSNFGLSEPSLRLVGRPKSAKL